MHWQVDTQYPTNMHARIFTNTRFEVYFDLHNSSFINSARSGYVSASWQSDQDGNTVN